MSQPSVMDAIFYLLVLILPLSALAARRLPIAATLKMAIAWLAIFLLLLLIVGQRDRLRAWWRGSEIKTDSPTKPSILHNVYYRSL